ncbi:MAG TPA: sulfite exporter TauE/SafE family protein [Chloroflexota bacterium]|nr:sulfite exporter TauE/SafE family protein [Chloroflexota bacterium]
MPLVIVTFAAAIVLGTTGFGFGLFSTPFFMLLVDPHEAVILSLLFSFIIMSVMLSRREIRENVRHSFVLPLFAFSLLGIPIGASVLLAIDGQVLRVGVCCLVIVTSCIMLCRTGVRRKNGILAVAMVGFTSGLLATSTSLSGTPVALFATTEEMSKSDFRSSLAAYGWLNMLVSLAMLRVDGLVLDRTLFLTVAALPALLIGYWCGSHFFGRLSHSRFSQMVPFLVIAAGLAGLVLTFG